jgi:hypothetical protein
MTASLNNVAVQQFSVDFENVYQAMSNNVPNTIMTVRGVVGDAYKTKLAGEIVLHERGAFQSAIPPSDVTYTPKTISFENYIALLPSDIFEQAEVNASERQNLARSSAWAILRRETQLIIDEMVAGFGTSIAAGGTNMTMDKMLEAKAVLDRLNVPPGDRFALIHANTLQSMLQLTEVTNSQYNTIRALMAGEVDTWLGFKWNVLGNMTEGGLPVDGDDVRSTFFYSRSALMSAYGVLEQGGNPGITVDWLPQFQSYGVIPKIRMGVKTQQGNGIVKDICDET